jgi:predicted transcriptional regulator
MYFNLWVQKQIEDLQITRTELCNTTGLSYSSLNTSKKFMPRLSNLVLICEVLTELKQGDRAYFDALILEAIKASSRDYRYAVERMEKNQ